jgi:hypothetical protein
MGELTTERESTLYDLLAEAPAPGTLSGETSLTATKETLDADAEEVSEEDVIHLRGA